MRILMVAMVLISIAALTQAVEPPPQRGAGTRMRLFDGKTFRGWEGDKSIFRIEKGAIVGGSLANSLDRNHFLCTEREYGDFELTLQFKLIGEGANAGVQIRSQRVPNDTEVSGYQADLGDGWWGALYDESRRNRPLIVPKPEVIKLALKPGDWNRYRIRCEGRRIRLWINGKQTIDYTEAESGIPERGIIGLQVHGGGPSEAWYKDIVIEELNTDAWPEDNPFNEPME